MSWINKRILVLYSISNILYQITFAICELAILRFIEPNLIGIWQIVLLVQSYSYFSRLGMLSAMNREYPFSIGKKDTDKANNIYATTHVYSAFNAILLFFLFIILAKVYTYKGEEWVWGFYSMALVVFFEMFSTYYESTLRSINRFDIVAKFQLSFLLILITSLLLPWQYNFMGLCLRAVLIAFFRFLLLLFLVKRTHILLFSYSRKTFKFLFSIGWKMWLWGYLKSVNRSIPRLIIATFESTYILGLFTPVNWMKTIFYNFATSIGSYIYPNLSYQYAKQKLAVGKHTLRITIFTALFSIPFTIIGVLTLPIVIRTFLSQYTSVIIPMQIALVSSVFEIFLMGNIAFATRKAWSLMYWHAGLTIALRGIIIYTFYYLFEDKLLGVSWGLLVSSIIVALLTVFFVKKVDLI